MAASVALPIVVVALTVVVPLGSARGTAVSLVSWTVSLVSRDIVGPGVVALVARVARGPLVTAGRILAHRWALVGGRILVGLVGRRRLGRVVVARRICWRLARFIRAVTGILACGSITGRRILIGRGIRIWRRARIWRCLFTSRSLRVTAARVGLDRPFALAGLPPPEGSPVPSEPGG